VPVILALAAALASFLPASRAAAVNPAEALRAE
jgi:ABC-type lipoprotein release transport system permease subunit